MLYLNENYGMREATDALEAIFKVEQRFAIDPVSKAYAERDHAALQDMCVPH